MSAASHACPSSSPGTAPAPCRPGPSPSLKALCLPRQVDPKLVMEQADPEGGSGKSTLLYQLHRLIVLSP